MEVGRPEEFKEEYIALAEKYLKSCKDREKKFHKTQGLRTDTYERLVKVKLPTIEGFAEYLGVSRKSIYNWEKNYPDFAVALEKIRTSQFTRLVNNGLSGDYNPIIAKLILTSNYGMKDRVDETSGDEPISPFSDEQVDRIAERITSRRGVNGDTSSEEITD